MKKIGPAMVTVLCSVASHAIAQPEAFVDLGSLREQVTLELSVQLETATGFSWFRCSLGEMTSTRGFLDMWTTGVLGSSRNLGYPGIGVFDASGHYVTGVGHNGSMNQACLSVGQMSPRRPTLRLPGDDQECLSPFYGRNGTAPSGEYWIAVGNGDVSFDNNWWARTYVHPFEQLQRVTTLYIRVQPPDVPFCDPDLNWDGNADQDDVAYLLDLVTNPSPIDPNNVCGADPDYNRDGTADFGDVLALVDVIAGGECP